MTATALFPSFPLRRLAISRLRFALAASVAGHLLALVFATEPLGGRPVSEEAGSLTVRLAPQPTAERTDPASPEPEIAVIVPRTMKRPRPVNPVPYPTADTALVPAPHDAPAPSLPRIPDPTYYGARDLDDYPRPVTPLALDRIAAGNTAPMQIAVTLRIDEQGFVNEVSFPEPVTPDRLREELRGTLAATRFTPAHKDGRAVKSRIILRVDLSKEQHEQ